MNMINDGTQNLFRSKGAKASIFAVAGVVGSDCLMGSAKDENLPAFTTTAALMIASGMNRPRSVGEWKNIETAPIWLKNWRLEDGPCAYRATTLGGLAALVWVGQDLKPKAWAKILHPREAD